ncbi:hypothetical protein Prudu_022256, partial [Prunus dulcis]
FLSLLSLPPVAPSPCDPSTSRRDTDRHTSSRSPKRAPSAPPPSRHHDLTVLHLGPPGAGRKVAISDGCSPDFHPIFQLFVLLRFSTKSIETDFSYRRSLGAVSSNRRIALNFGYVVPHDSRIHHQAIHSFRATKGDSANFRHKSKGKYKKNLKREGCRTRTGLGSNSKAEMGSGPRLLAPPPSTNGRGTGGVGTAIESPTFSDRPPPLGSPELVGKHQRSSRPQEGPSKGPISSDHSGKFGFGQNTGETLPNFRQKSKGKFKKN